MAETLRYVQCTAIARSPITVRVFTRPVVSRVGPFEVVTRSEPDEICVTLVLPGVSERLAAMLLCSDERGQRETIASILKSVASPNSPEQRDAPLPAPGSSEPARTESNRFSLIDLDEPEAR